MIVGARTRTGEAVHATTMTLLGNQSARGRKTLCGREVAYIDRQVPISETGIQHPWRCTKCHRKIRKDS